VVPNGAYPQQTRPTKNMFDFAAQVEALKRYRSRGDQTVRVEHVTVNEGGQAIVGKVNHGGAGSPQK